MKQVNPIYNEPYEKLYGSINFTGSRILEFGADSGSTAYFFLEHGAKEVISVEGLAPWFNSLVENIDNDERVIPIYLWINSPKQIEELIAKYHPNISHFDCENCEYHLLAVPDEVFRIPTTYSIEIHKGEWNQLFTKKLLDNGYGITKHLVPCDEGAWNIMIADRVDKNGS